MKRRLTLAIEDKEIPVEDIIILQEEMPFPPLGEEMVEKIKRTIKRYGLVYKPVVIPTKEGNKTKYYLIDGRSRLNALMKLNCREIPCTIINALPEERKALYYVIECFRRHLPESEREQAENKLNEVEEDLTLQIREKVKSFLALHGVPKNIISHIIKSIAPEELTPLYNMLEDNNRTLVPLLKTVLETSSEKFSEKDISQTRGIIEELEKEGEKEKAELERKVKELLTEKQKSDERIRELESEITSLESEIEKLRRQITQINQASLRKPLSLNDPEVKELVDRYVQEKAKKEADEIVKVAIKRAMDEQAELQKRLNEILSERNKYLREKQDLENKVQELEKRNRILGDKIKSWQDSAQYLRNLLSRIVSVETVLEEMDTVVTRLKSIYTSLMYLKGTKVETIQETHVYSLEKKREEIEGYLRQVEKVINDIKNVLKDRALGNQDV